MPYAEDIEKLVRGRKYSPMTADEMAEALSVRGPRWSSCGPTSR